MTASVYSRLPSKFDFHSYYAAQAAGGPSFPVYRARQHGGSFLSPLIKRHGIPFLKWLGRQAATVATGMGNRFLEKGSLNKDDMKGLLKSQGKKAAHSALDKIKQQVGAGATMSHRRDGRLGSLVPTTTKRREGMLSPLHGIRAPFPSEYALGSPPEVDSARKVSRKKPRKKAASEEGVMKRRGRKPKSTAAKRKSGKPKKTGKRKKKLNPGLRAYLDNKKKTIFS